MNFPTQTAELFCDGPAGQLQTLVEFPQNFHTQSPCVLICHPHPPDGGTMHNKVVSTLNKAFVEAGFIAVRFNFRGVQKSQGDYTGGEGELQDCLALLRWLKTERPQAPIALAGFSFGAWIALNAAEYFPSMLMVSVAPPVGFRDFTRVKNPRCVWLAVQGAADEIVDSATVLQWLNTQNPAPEIIEMPATSHFFHGKLIPLREHVLAFLKRQIS